MCNIAILVKYAMFGIFFQYTLRLYAASKIYSGRLRIPLLSIPRPGFSLGLARDRTLSPFFFVLMVEVA